MLEHAVDGRAKFWVTWRALQLLREAAPLLRDAIYLPLEAQGTHAAHVVAFARGRGAQWLVVVAVRLYAGLGRPVGEAPLGEAWGDTAVLWPESLPAPADDAWLENRIDGQRLAPREGRLALRELLREFPVAALFGAAVDHDDDHAGTEHSAS
jgi:(1->4)-alpha-D-glucan 1-alpha-D-glucosylmutase